MYRISQVLQAFVWCSHLGLLPCIPNDKNHSFPQDGIVVPGLTLYSLQFCVFFALIEAKVEFAALSEGPNAFHIDHEYL